MRHCIADVGQTQQHQRNTQNGVENGHHFAGRRLRCNVPISFKNDNMQINQLKLAEFGLTWYRFLEIIRVALM